MPLLPSLFYVLILPIVLAYFIPIHPYFGNHYLNPYLLRGYGDVPVVANESQTYYPNVRSMINVPHFWPYVVPYPFMSLNEEKSEDVLKDEIKGKAIGPTALKSNLLKKLTSLDVTFNKEKEDPHVAKCREEFEGTLVNNECYRYFSEPLSFEDARMFCQEEGGDLWTPDPEDTFLYYKLGYLMLEFATAADDSLLIGAKVDPTGLNVITVNHEDIAGTFLMNVDDGYAVNDCINLGFAFGGFLAFGEDCATPNQFICEYPMEEDSVMGSMINKFTELKNKLKIWEIKE